MQMHVCTSCSPDIVFDCSSSSSPLLMCAILMTETTSGLECRCLMRLLPSWLYSNAVERTLVLATLGAHPLALEGPVIEATSGRR